MHHVGLSYLALLALLPVLMGLGHAGSLLDAPSRPAPTLRGMGDVSRPAEPTPLPPPPSVDRYPWLRDEVVLSLDARIPVPHGLARIPLEAGSFGEWLRGLPMRPGLPPVVLHDGSLKANQSAHHAVIEIDVGDRDLQQCADAILRLRAEYLWVSGCADSIVFCFTSGDPATWRAWKAGYRPSVKGSMVTWARTAPADESYDEFRTYLESVFTYAGSASLERELSPVADPSKPEIGDVFIQGGFPGHAVIVVDVAEGPDAVRWLLLAQSFMPAQSIHILRNPGDPQCSPWYRARASGRMQTPEWEFRHEDLRRFAPLGCP